MTPFQQAGEFADAHMGGFERWLIGYHEHGYVFSEPEFFIAGRPIDTHEDPAFYAEPTILFPRETHDAWFIVLYAGDIRKALTHMPYRLPWVYFYRKDGDLRKIPMERFESFLYNGSKPAHQSIAE